MFLSLLLFHSVVKTLFLEKNWEGYLFSLRPTSYAMHEKNLNLTNYRQDNNLPRHETGNEG